MSVFGCFWGVYTPEGYHGYPKLWFGKADSFLTWPFLVSMFDFWCVSDLFFVIRNTLPSPLIPGLKPG